MNPVRLYPACSRWNSMRFVEGVRHRTADQKHIDLFYQRLDHGNLIGDP